MTKICRLSCLFPSNNFYDGDKKIIGNIIEAIKNRSAIDIRSIVQVNYTSQSSISRLSKRTSFNNFKEFIFFLSNEFSHESINQLETLPFVMVNQDWDLTNSYFNSTFSNKKIYLFGEGFYQTLASCAYRKLLLKKIYAIDLEGVEIGLASNQTPYALITFSQSDENKDGLLKMEECKKYGGKVIALTAAENGSYTVKSDFPLIVESEPTSIDHGNQNLNYFSGNCLNLVEYLINRYTKIPKA